jgi:Domain of unknown function (DUF5063)
MIMTREDIRHAVLEYLDLIENGSTSFEENLKSLELALDKLALAHNFIDFQFDEIDYPENPAQDYKRLRQLAEQRFPDFGYYNMPDCVTDKIAGSAIIVGDAFDDVADIALDMHEIAWCWAHTSPENALWHFQFGYESHWGDHLRCLQIYILRAKKGL